MMRFSLETRCGIETSRLEPRDSKLQLITIGVTRCELFFDGVMTHREQAVVRIESARDRQCTILFHCVTSLHISTRSTIQVNHSI